VHEEQLNTSERLASLCDLAWRRRHGQRPNPAFGSVPSLASALDAVRVERVVSRLDQLAPLWNRLPVGGQLALTWPSLLAHIEPHIQSPAIDGVIGGLDR
jgi:hypothetical protein